jgi:glycosyltransferase involved in cell wall biosynthesis
MSENIENLPKQTIVIPIRNEAQFIAATIGFLQGQDYPHEKMEIIIVDGESDDGTVSIVSEIAAGERRVKLLRNPRQLSSAARNIGARSATGEIITFIDGHTFIDNDQLLRNIALAMTEYDISVLSRPQFLETPDNDMFQRAVALARRTAFGHGLDSTIYLERDEIVDPTSSGASYRREVFDKIGYFDERFDAAEDWEFNYRAHLNGYRSFTSPKLAVYYYPRRNFGGLFRQMMRYGIGRFRFFRKHRSGLGSGALFPTAFVLGPPAMLLLSIAWPASLLIFAFGVGLYLFLALASSIYISFKNGWGYFRLLPFIYMTIHWSLGWGFLAEMMNTILGNRSWRSQA